MVTDFKVVEVEMSLEPFFGRAPTFLSATWPEERGYTGTGNICLFSEMLDPGRIQLVLDKIRGRQN